MSTARGPRLPVGATVGEPIFPALCAARGLPRPEPEYYFARPRQFRFDYAWPAYLLALEIEGGIYGRGKRDPLTGRRRVAGHTSIDRLLRDIEKYNLAAILGWRLLRCTVEQFNRGDAVALVGLAFTAQTGELR